MDRICCAVLNKICAVSSPNRYVVFSEDELLEVFPEDAAKGENELKKALKTLVNAGYIDLKYSGGELYCIAPLKKYEPQPEIEIKKSEVAPPKRKNGFYFLSAFAGGALGSFIISLIFALLRYA